MITSANNISSYALAIFTIAKNKETQEKYYQQIAALDAMNDTNPDFFKILAARFIDKNERKEIAKDVLTGFGFEQKVIYWVWTIIDNNFYNQFHSIAKACRDIYCEIFDVCRVKITSANELSESQMDKIKNFFEVQLKRKIEIAWYIKPSLLGGLRIQVDNKTYNNTFRTKLDGLKKELLSKKGYYGN